jgi:DNA ligase-1
MQKQFPTLYKKASTGAIWSWRIFVTDSTIHEQWGIDGGAQQTTTDLIKEGKNQGRSNATTPQEQAVAEAKSKWEKKVKSGYVESKKDAEKGKNELGGYPPMLAKSAADIHEKYLTFPCYIQPKLDGLRCVSTLDGQYSRTRKPLNFPHIQKEIDRIRKEYPELAQAEFDGEIYLHKMSDNFQDLMSIARKENHPQQHILEYHVYDIIDDSKSFTDRYVKPFSKLKLSGPVKVVPTFLCKNQEEVDALEQRFIEEGYEGAMRRTDAPYEFKRSANLLKIKRFEDSEFEVLGIEEGRGKLAGHAGALKFKTKKGIDFNAKPAMPDSMLKQIFENPKKYMGLQATIKYQGVSNDGVPRFPVVKDFRED